MSDDIAGKDGNEKGPDVEIVQVGDRELRWSGRIQRFSGPILEYYVVGNRILIFSQSPEEAAQGRDGFRAVALIQPPMKSTMVVGSVEAGTRISLPADSLNAFITPTGVRVETPGQLIGIQQISAGFGVVLANRDVPRSNVFMYGNDGSFRWRIGENPFDSGHYSYLEVKADKLVAIIDQRSWWCYLLDTSTGRILSKTSPP